MSRSRALALLVCLLVLPFVRGSAHAQDISRPAWVRSLQVTETGATVRAGPSTHAPRRGTVRLGTYLPVEARVTGLGCSSWYRIGPEQFICEELVSPSGEPPSGASLPVVPAGELLPRRYAFVAADGTWAYARPSDYFLDEMVESLGRGFGLAVTEQREEQGVTFFRSLGGVWVPSDVLRFARGSLFEGVEIADGQLDVAWVSRANAELRAWNGRAAGRVIRRLGRRDVLHVLEDVGRGLLRTSEGVVRARDVIRTSSEAPPTELTEGERWIDVDLTSQTLVAYEGARPVFATLVSSGRSGPGHETPVGVHRIWVKLAEDTMDDLDRTDQESNYAIEAVPWVQYFAEGVGLHAAFWHDDFGHPRSHGCVNLSPRDARRLFAWTTPELPPGWDAILTVEGQLGTIVRVRGRASRR
ncbi:MAG: L,D-transpeptidase family protein [Sandaracinaceae bacterium]|nr:L,D-transpeptidase family protein [Sandaracinaceae bacterium]